MTARVSKIHGGTCEDENHQFVKTTTVLTTTWGLSCLWVSYRVAVCGRFPLETNKCEEISDEPLANNASDWLEITANLDSGQSIIPMTNDISKRISACDGQDEM